VFQGANYYIHNNWIGNSPTSSTVPATGNGAVAYDRAFAPYGEVYANYSFTGSLTFAGDTSYLVTGLYDTPNRELAQSQGRWLSPDPAGQGWNLYAYPTDPNRFIDPSGLDCISSVDGHVVEGDCEGKDPNHEYYVDCNGCLFNSSGYEVDAATGNITFLDANGKYIPGTTIAGFMDPLEDAVGGTTDAAANNGGWWGTFGSNLFSNWSWGVRGSNQTYGQCLAGNSGNYSLAGAAGLDSSGAKLAGGNDVASLLFGDAAEGQAGLFLAEGGTHSISAGIGTVGTMGRRTSSVFDLNLAGTPGGTKGGIEILGKTGAEELAGWLSGAAELKFAGDVGATGSLMLGCLTHP
jgi:RHS repeat-associated protein